jgi:hypothetical protein
MAKSKAIPSRAGLEAYQRVLRYPQARGKTIELVELAVSSDYFTLEIRFQDKTSLAFYFESRLLASPEFVNWETGEYKPVKRWRPVHSKSSRD